MRILQPYQFAASDIVLIPRLDRALEFNNQKPKETFMVSCARKRVQTAGDLTSPHPVPPTPADPREGWELPPAGRPTPEMLMDVDRQWDDRQTRPAGQAQVRHWLDTHLAVEGRAQRMVGLGAEIRTARLREREGGWRTDWPTDRLSVCLSVSPGEETAPTGAGAERPRGSAAVRQRNPGSRPFPHSPAKRRAAVASRY